MILHGPVPLSISTLLSQYFQGILMNNHVTSDRPSAIPVLSSVTGIENAFVDEITLCRTKKWSNVQT